MSLTDGQSLNLDSVEGRIPNQSPISGNEWAFRSDYWVSEHEKLQKPRRKRERNSNPLILCGHGMSMRVDKGTLFIREGFTQYPQPQEPYRFFKGDLNLPPRIVVLDGSGSVSFDVLDWLAEQNIILVRLTWDGRASFAVGGSAGALNREKVEWQYRTRDNEADRLSFSLRVIARKIEHSIKTLQTAIPASIARSRAIETAEAKLAVLNSGQVSDLETLRSIEAICAKTYFAAWEKVGLEWKAAKQFPVPDHWHGYSGRASDANDEKARNVNASHPINAMLNYAYSVRHSQLHLDAVADGYDPQIGIMHHGRWDKPAFIFDLIEPERPVVDKAILRFAKGRTFSGADFILKANGICRLSPQLAKAIAALTLNLAPIQIERVRQRRRAQPSRIDWINAGIEFAQ